MPADPATAALLASPIVDAAVKGTAILGLAAIATLLLRRRSPALRHALWTATMTSLLVLPLLTAFLPRLAILPGPAVAASPALPALPVAAPDAPSLSPALPDTVIAPALVRAAPAAAPLPRARSWSAILALLWLTGVLLCISPLLIAPLVLGRWLARHARPDAVATRLASELPHRLHRGRDVPVLITHGEHMPLATGLLCPRILLPASSAHWPPDRLRSVLLHEFAHLQRRDLHTQALARLARALYWFHPLAWIACRQMDIEREKACDDRVLADTADAAGYAQTLLDLATLFHGRPLMRYAAVSMARPSTLETRIRAILRPEGSRGAITRSILLAMTAGGLALTTLVATLSAAPSAPAAKPGDAPQTAAASEPAVSIAAIAATDGGPYWDASGAPAIFPLHSPRIATDKPTDNRLIILRTARGNSGLIVDATFPGWDRTLHPILRPVGIRSDDARSASSSSDAYYAFTMPEPVNVVVGATIRAGVATGPWTTVTKGPLPLSGSVANGRYVTGTATQLDLRGQSARFNSMPNVEIHNVLLVTFAYNLTDADVRLVAVDREGHEHPMDESYVQRQDNLQQVSAQFANILLADIVSFELQTRPITWINFTNVPLDPDKAASRTAQIQRQDRESRIEMLEQMLSAQQSEIRDRLKKGLTADVAQLRQQEDKLRSELAALTAHAPPPATQPAPAAADLSTQDLIAQIKTLQEQLALLATVPHGPYVASPDGPQEASHLTDEVRRVREQINRLNEELARRAGG